MKSMHRMTEMGFLEREKNESDCMETFPSRFMSVLRARKEEVEKALALLVDRQKEYKQSFSDATLIENLDHAEREIATNTYYTLMEKKTRELKKIEFLISRIMKDEEFGLCDECGDEIPEERLLIIPEATLCVPCQSKLEKMNSRGKLSEQSHNISLNGKKGPQWEGVDDSKDDREFMIETDMEGLYFNDLEETELVNALVEEV